jgi:hypothetical protein
MRRVWQLDVLECPRCLGRMKIVAAIHAPDSITKILDSLGLPSPGAACGPGLPRFPNRVRKHLVASGRNG